MKKRRNKKMANLGPFAPPPVTGITPEQQKVKDALVVLGNAKAALTAKTQSDTSTWDTFIGVSQTPAGYLFVDQLVYWQKQVMGDTQLMRELLALENDINNWGLNAPPNVPEGTPLAPFPSIPVDLAAYIKSLS